MKVPNADTPENPNNQINSRGTTQNTQTKRNLEKFVSKIVQTGKRTRNLTKRPEY